MSDPQDRSCDSSVQEKINGKAAAKENRELLPTDRPKPLIKDRPRRAQKVRNLSSFPICTAQLNAADNQLAGAHHISRAECPKLAAKFAESIPHRFTVTQDDESDDAREHAVSRQLCHGFIQPRQWELSAADDGSTASHSPTAAQRGVPCLLVPAGTSLATLSLFPLSSCADTRHSCGKTHDDQPPP